MKFATEKKAFWVFPELFTDQIPTNSSNLCFLFFFLSFKKQINTVKITYKENWPKLLIHPQKRKIPKNNEHFVAKKSFHICFHKGFVASVRIVTAQWQRRAWRCCGARQKLIKISAKRWFSFSLLIRCAPWERHDSARPGAVWRLSQIKKISLSQKIALDKIFTAWQSPTFHPPHCFCFFSYIRPLKI